MNKKHSVNEAEINKINKTKNKKLCHLKLTH
jgi:hypothetical protein